MKKAIPPNHKAINFTINNWHFDKIKTFATENGMTVRAAIRFIINQFFKDKPY